MRKIFPVMLAITAVLSFSAAVFAGDEVKVKGTVAKIDESAQTITIQPKDGDAVTVIMEDADKLAKVKEGEKAEVKYAMKDGKNLGIKVRKLSEGCQ